MFGSAIEAVKIMKPESAPKSEEIAMVNLTGVWEGFYTHAQSGNADVFDGETLGMLIAKGAVSALENPINDQP